MLGSALPFPFAILSLPGVPEARVQPGLGWPHVFDPPVFLVIRMASSAPPLSPLRFSLRCHHSHKPAHLLNATTRWSRELSGRPLLDPAGPGSGCERPSRPAMPQASRARSRERMG